MEELIKIQSDLKAPKEYYNSFGKYKYRSCESILEAAKPLLKTNNCILTISDCIEQIGERYYIKAEASLKNKEGVCIKTYGYAREPETKKGMDGSQITGAASSYARKYALNGLFCIDDTKDVDMSPQQKPVKSEKEKNEDLITAVSELGKCKTVAEIKNVWETYDYLQHEMIFKDAAKKRKDEIKEK